jgi:hypothetical protein
MSWSKESYIDINPIPHRVPIPKNLLKYIVYSCYSHVENIDWKLELYMATHGHIHNGSNLASCA